MSKPALSAAVLLVLVMLATACGGDAAEGDRAADATVTSVEAEATEQLPTAEPSDDPVATAEATAAEPTEAAPTEAAATEAPTTETPATEAAANEAAATDGTRQDPQPGVHSAGALTITAQRCTIDGAEFVGDSSSRVMPGIAVLDPHVYLSNADGQTLRFVADTTAGCALTIDPTWGDAGTYTPASAQDALNIAQATGRLVMSGSVFESEVVDTTTGASYVCDASGKVEITPDGSLGVAYFPGSAIRQVNFTDTGCTVDDPAPQAASLAYEHQTILSGQFAPGGQFVTGGILPGNLAQVIAYTEDGAEVWRQGESDPDSFGDQRYGWVHAVSLCGATPAVCTLDTNFRRLQVLDPAGTWVTSADLNELLDIESAWWEDMEFDAAGRIWMPVGAGRDEGDLADGFLFLLTLDGI